MNNHLPIALSAAVLLYMLELQEGGGPTLKDVESCKDIAQLIAEKGDQLLYRGKETSIVFNELARGIAILSYAPGGVTVFGQHYETK